jgi:hypothetical protein
MVVAHGEDVFGDGSFVANSDYGPRGVAAAGA